MGLLLDLHQGGVALPIRRICIVGLLQERVGLAQVAGALGLEALLEGLGQRLLLELAGEGAVAAGDELVELGRLLRRRRIGIRGGVGYIELRDLLAQPS